MSKMLVGVQGNRPNDWMHCKDGEKLRRPTYCGGSIRPNGCANLGHTCGCNRSWVGVETALATTVAKVVYMDGPSNLPSEAWHWPVGALVEFDGIHTRRIT